MNDFKTEDLHKIIDDAMEKKDREVTIFISKDHTHITVTPLQDTKPRWIILDRGPSRRRPKNFQCSECGAYSENLYAFCPFCGEKLALPVVEAKEGMDDEDPKES